MGVRLFESQGCSCEYEEIGNNVSDSNAKGYTKVVECDDCRTQREAEAAAAEAKRIADEEAAATKEANKESAITKLLALGLSQDEIDAILK